MLLCESKICLTERCFGFGEVIGVFHHAGEACHSRMSFGRLHSSEQWLSRRLLECNSNMRAHRESVVGWTCVEHPLQQWPEMHRDFGGQCHLHFEALDATGTRARTVRDRYDNSIRAQRTHVKELMDVVRYAAAEACTK